MVYCLYITSGCSRIDLGTGLALPLGEHIFLADGTDTVVPLLTFNEATGEAFPPRSFTQFNDAVNKSINHYAEIDPEDLFIGGNKVLFDALYGE